MNWLRNLSLKFKLILLLVFLTGSMLATFGGMAIRDFEKDKLAYVLDTGLEHSRSSAMQIRTEIGYVADKMKFLLRGYDQAANAFHPYMTANFSGETLFDALISFQKDSTNGRLRPAAILKKSDLAQSETDEIFKIVDGISEKMGHQEVRIARPTVSGKWLLVLRFTIPGGDPIITAALLNHGHFLSLFQSSQILDTFVIGEKNEIVFQPIDPTYKIAPQQIAAALADGTKKLKSNEGIFQYQNKNVESLLVASAGIGLGGLRVVSFVPRSAALEAVRLMVVKSALFLAFLFCVTVFLSVLSSTSLTASLKKLLAATREITAGNFLTTVDVRGNDEIGSLSRGFNTMAVEISRLMQETAEKARMEGELKTAQLVQATLFPKEHFQDDTLEIHGYYEPASECSGDWWYYKRIGDNTMFCIGDATGHGVSAALLTAAARSAASALETFPQLPLNEMMSVFNRAIYSTAQGQVLMTLFLGLYNHTSGAVTYCNASHEPPYFLPNLKTLKKSDLHIMNEASGPRLGQDPESTYSMARILFTAGDKIVLYTDGVTDLKNKADSMWGERALIKCLLNSHNTKQDLRATMKQITHEISTFREEHPLQDDVTFFMVKKSLAS